LSKGDCSLYTGVGIENGFRCLNIALTVTNRNDIILQENRSSTINLFASLSLFLLQYLLTKFTLFTAFCQSFSYTLFQSANSGKRNFRTTLIFRTKKKP